MSETILNEQGMKKNSISQDNPKALKNPWVLGWLALLGVVLAVNIGFISLAFITNPGLVDEDYYIKSQDFEENLMKYRAAKAALGWTYQADFPSKPIMKKNEMYRLSVVDKAGLPLTAATITVKAYRPSDVSADFETTLSEVGAGIYEGHVSFPLKGIWDITVNIARDKDEFDFTRRASILAQ